MLSTTASPWNVPDPIAVTLVRCVFASVLTATGSKRAVTVVPTMLGSEGDRTILVPEGDAAEFSTMIPHAICAYQGPAEVLSMMDHAGERAHLPSVRTGPAARDDDAPDV